MAVPGFEPGSSGSQPLMLTTTLYHQNYNSEEEAMKFIWCNPSLSLLFFVYAGPVLAPLDVSYVVPRGHRTASCAGGSLAAAPLKEGFAWV